jgi:predicted lipoprotein with Yx(FWY)xxD motif
MADSRSPAATSRLALALGGVGLVAAACGGSYGASKASSNSSATPAAASSGGKVALAVHTGGTYGTYLTDAQGHSLYMFAADSAGRSACTGSCSTYWPPLVGSPGSPASTTVKGAMVGTITRDGGATQLTYAGHPLYRYVGDAKAGDTKGEGLNLSGGKWWLVDPAGTAIHGSAPAPSSGSGSSGYGGGYGGYGNG